MKKNICVLFPFILFLFVCAGPKKPEPQDTNYPDAPDFSLKDLKGNDVSLSACKGKVIFLNFWATWCPPCRQEIPGFVEAYREYKEKGMAIIGISLDETGPASILKFAESFKINYPLVMATAKIFMDYRPGNLIPATIIIDKKGKIRKRHVGYMDKATLKSYFLKLAEEK
jgi:cytochrome c biogenesis protein CcmG/thiol:disulfide interchange protein DsbE